MRRYWDTSALIRASILGIVPEGVTRSHSVTEFFGIFTGTGVNTEDGKRSLSPRDAIARAKRVFEKMEFVDLTPQETITALEKSLSYRDIAGRNVHDWLHCQAAEKAKASKIMTLNFNDFSRMTEIGLEIPVLKKPLGNAGP